MKDLDNIILIEQGKLLSKALKIVDKLADNDLADMDGTYTTDQFQSDELKDLILKSRSLKNDRWWEILIKGE